MLAGEVSSTRKKQELVIQSNSSTKQGFNLYYKGSVTVDWGDGTKNYLYSGSNTTSRVFSHTYSTTYSGEIKIRGNVNLIRRIDLAGDSNTGLTQSQIKKLSSLDYFTNGGVNGNCNFDINNMPSNLTYIYNLGKNISYGNINNGGLANGLTYFTIIGSNTISGDISNFFGTLLPNGDVGPNTKLPNLSVLHIEGQNQLSGDLSGLSRGINIIQGYPSLTYFHILGNNTITGDIYNFIYNAGLTRITLGGNNTVYGDLSSLYSSVDTLEISGNNTITGDIVSLSQYSAPFKIFNIRGNNTTYGDISSLPTSLTYYYNSGYNTVTGDIQYLPALSGFYCLGYNTVYGDISTIKPSLGSFYVSGYNTLSGDISILSSLTNLNIFAITGKTTVYGDIQYLPPSLDSFTITSNGIISGTISMLNTPTLTTFAIGATNSISGNISDFPSTVNYLSIYKNTNKLTYTGKIWPEGMIRVVLQPSVGKGLTTAEVDQILIDLSHVVTWSSTSGGHYVYLAGHNEPHSAVSNVAIGILISKGVNVVYNI